MAAMAGIDIALWDIKGKAYGKPVYELLGGPTRDKIRVYGRAYSPGDIPKGIAQGFTAFKTSPMSRSPSATLSPGRTGEVETKRSSRRRLEPL